MKKTIASIFAVILMISNVIICSAANSYTISFTHSNKKCTWETSGVQCTLSNKKKNASVKVGLSSSYVSKYGYYATDIAMKDSNGGTIWAENNSIVAKKSYTTYRTYTLGKDHSVYRLYFRPSNKQMNGAAYVTVSNPKNCSLSLCNY